MELIVKNLSFAYKDSNVLENVCLEVKSCEVCAILGPNGSGKTTLIKCLSKLLEPKSGEIIFAGNDIKNLTNRELARTFAYVPQIYAGNFAYTVNEMVLMGRTPYLGYFASPAQEDYEVVHKVLSELELLHLKDRSFNELSGGEKQLVYLARALAQDAKVLLMDEPTAHLDFKNTLLIINILRKIVNQKKLIAIVALHNPNEVFWLCDKVLVLHNGRVVNYGTPGKVINPSTMKDIYGVSVEIFHKNGRKCIIPK